MAKLPGFDEQDEFQSLLNAFATRRQQAVAAAETATEKAGEAAGSATAAGVHRSAARGWAEGEEVIALPDAGPESRSAKGWALHAGEVVADIEEIRDEAAALVSGAAGVAQAHGSAVSLARLLMGDAESVWNDTDVVDDVVVTNGEWTPVTGGLGPTLEMGAGVGRMTRTFDLTASPSTNPLAGMETAALYLMADEPWTGTVRILATYADQSSILGGGAGIAVRNHALVLEQLDRPDGATTLTITVSWQIEDDATIGEGALVLAPFVGVSAAAAVATGGGGLAARRLSLVERSTNTLVTPAYSGVVLVLTEPVTVTLPDTLPAGFQLRAVNRAASGVVTFSANEIINPAGTKLEVDGLSDVIHLGDGEWVIGGLLTT